MAAKGHRLVSQSLPLTPADDLEQVSVPFLSLSFLSCPLAVLGEMVGLSHSWHLVSSQCEEEVLLLLLLAQEAAPGWACLAAPLSPTCLVLEEPPGKPKPDCPLRPPLPRPHPATSPQFCLELYNPSCRGQKIKACKTDGEGKVVEGKHESYRISASSAEERDQWIQAIR